MYLLCIMGLFLATSCSTEESSPIEGESIASSQLAKKEMSVEMENFRDAMIVWMKAKHNPNASKSTEKSNRILMEESRLLLESNGAQLETVDGKQALNENEIISKAMRLYAQKTRVTLNQQP